MIYILLSGSLFNFKVAQFSVDKYNLSTDEGTKMKKQRSIQVEGAFGVIKEDIGYEKIRRRGKENVRTEILLVLIGFNLRKYYNKKQRRDKTIN